MHANANLSGIQHALNLAELHSSAFRGNSKETGSENKNAKRAVLIEET